MEEGGHRFFQVGSEAGRGPEAGMLFIYFYFIDWSSVFVLFVEGSQPTVFGGWQALPGLSVEEAGFFFFK